MVAGRRGMSKGLPVGDPSFRQKVRKSFILHAMGSDVIAEGSHTFLVLADMLVQRVWQICMLSNLCMFLCSAVVYLVLNSIDVRL